MAGIGRMAAPDLQRLGHGRLHCRQRLVCRAGQARVEPARLGLRSRLAGPLRRDGRRRLARVAAGRLGRTQGRAQLVRRTVGPQRPVDTPVLRPSPAWVGAGGDSGSPDCDSGDLAGLLARGPACRAAIAPLRRLGRIRHGAQLDDLADELKARLERTGEPAFGSESGHYLHTFRELRTDTSGLFITWVSAAVFAQMQPDLPESTRTALDPPPGKSKGNGVLVFMQIDSEVCFLMVCPVGWHVHSCVRKKRWAY